MPSSKQILRPAHICINDEKSMTDKQTFKDEDKVGLYSHKAHLEKFRARIAELQSSIQFGMENGHQLFYTVDFSEIYSYLHYGDPNVTDLGVNLPPISEEDQTKDKDQHYLALTHLFNTFSKNPLYLLQPYLLEMYSYTKNQAHRSVRVGRDLNTQLKEFVESLNDEHKKLLRSVKSEMPSSGQGKKLLELLASEYPRFSILLLEYERWREQNSALSTRGQLLKKMLTEKKLTNRVDEVLAAYNISPHDLEVPSLEEEKKIAEAFPHHPYEAEKKHAKKVDARALILLRNINRLLEPHGARLVLITRDLKSPTVAEQLEKEEWFGWTGVRKYFCDIESVYLDLILHSLGDDEEKLKWLIDADNELSNMVHSVEQLIQEFSSEGVTTSPVRELSASARELLNRNKQHWAKLMEVVFIRVSPKIEWLGEDFVRTQLFSEHDADGTPAPKIEAAMRSLLHRIVDLVDSPTFQALASQDIQNLWDNIFEDVHSMKWLSQFSGDLNEALNDLRELLSKNYDSPKLFASTVARSKSFINMPVIHFKNRDYNDFIDNFQPWTYSKEQLVDEVGRKLSQLFSQAFRNKDKPESYLFMAFILGMLDKWEQAIKIAEHGRGLLDKVNPEFNYFLAYAIWQDIKIKRRSGGYKYELVQYMRAIRLMWEALKVNPTEPRYLDRQGTTALECHYILRKLAGLGEDAPEEILNDETKISSESEALGFLESALKKAGNDRKLRVRILNNLTYSYGTIEPPNLEKAEKFHTEIVDELSLVKQNPNSTLPEFEKWQFVMDTRWYIGAKLAYSKKDAIELENNIRNLVSLHDKASLTDSERRAITSHLDEASEWLLKLKGEQV
jgi:hypothetical protein